MPVSPTYPGVYIEEIPSGVRTITGVSTSNTAFVGYLKRGPMNEATMITSFGDFQRKFGGLDSDCETSYAVRQYYLNGGSIAWIVRVSAGTPLASSLNYAPIDPLANISVSAKSEGAWGDNVQFAIDESTDSPGNFNLYVREVNDVAAGDLGVVSAESFMNLSLDSASDRYAVSIVNKGSQLVDITSLGAASFPRSGLFGDDAPTDTDFVSLTGGGNGSMPTDSVPYTGNEAGKEGIYALENIAPEIFNILCVPDMATMSDTDAGGLIPSCETYCEKKRAFLLVDSVSDWDSADNLTAAGDLITWVGAMRSQNAAIHYPRLEI
ncbi:MAG: hypothetical protein OEY78_11990, partial [Gammaproteobacteria bacterium]|nr:hypothetical protein [Gammaproteobacteria bacterium]